MNDPQGLDARRKELRARLRHDPRQPAEAPKWTKQEMQDAAARLMASVLNTGKIVH